MGKTETALSDNRLWLRYDGMDVESAIMKLTVTTLVQSTEGQNYNGVDCECYYGVEDESGMMMYAEAVLLWSTQ